MIQALSVLLPVAYAAAAGVAALDFLAVGPRGDDSAAASARRFTRARRWTLAVALLLHAGLFAARVEEVRAVPEFDAWWSISALAFTVALMHVAVAARQGVGGTDALVLAAAFVLQLGASAFAPLVTESGAARPVPFYLLHVASILVASAALVLSGLYGLLYLALFRQMRRRRFGAVFERLPSLQTLVRLVRRTGLVAFVLLLVGINGGIWWAHRADVPGFAYRDPGVLLMLALCVYFGAVAFSQVIPGLTARRTSFAAAIGLALLLASLGVFLTKASFHWPT